MIRNCLVLLLIAAVQAVPATAQTRMTPAPPTPPQQQPAANLPVPESTVRQARNHAEGEFGGMNRPRVGGQVQDAWDGATGGDGVFTYRACPACVYKVRLRERMVTAIELPEGETIDGADLGDRSGFQVETRSPRLLAVKPKTMGVDSNLVVYGASGAVYPFYLRAESYNSENVTDFLVRVTGAIETDGPDIAGAGPAAPAHAMDFKELGDAAAAGSGHGGVPADNEADGTEDFVGAEPFDPGKLRGFGDYELWGSEELRPETVYRDDHFTYIHFGDRWEDVELPTAYVVVDGIDELVNTRVNGTTFIVESVRPFISLKSGKSYLCIRYEGEAA